MKKRNNRKQGLGVFARWAVAALLIAGLTAPAGPGGTASAALAGAAATLKDISGSYAESEIQSLYQAGILSGYGEGTFGPAKPVTRAELAKILALALDLTPSPAHAAGFKDIPGDAWYRGYVGALAEFGITGGTSADTFSPGARVTREELVVFFVRAFGLEEKAKELDGGGEPADAERLAAWAKPSASLALRIGFVRGITGPDGRILFQPKAVAERQAVARLTYEFIHNGAQYKDRADELGTAAPTPPPKAAAVISASAASGTTVEVAFDGPIRDLNAGDFAFDGGLSIVSAAFAPGSGSTSLVVLTTGSQTPGQSYKLSYKGKDTGIAVTGYRAPSSPSSPSSPGIPGDAAAAALNRGETIDGDLSVASGGTIGPASGTAVVTGTLTLDPGPSGEIALRNVEADELVVASGSSHSIKLQGVSVIRSLQIHADGQTEPVRVVAQEGTRIRETLVDGSAILESGAGAFGPIAILQGATGRTVEFRGSFADTVDNYAPGATIGVAPNATVSQLRLHEDVKLQGSPEDIFRSSIIADPAVEYGGDVYYNPLVGLALTQLAEEAGSFQNKYPRLDQMASFTNEMGEHVGRILGRLTVASYVGASLMNGWDELEQGVYELIDPVLRVKRDLEGAARALPIQYAEGDNAYTVKRDISLSAEGANGTSVSWRSDQPGILTSAGKVTRPPKDTTVTLTATIGKKGMTVEQTFILKVKAAVSSLEIVDVAATSSYDDEAKQVLLESLRVTMAAPIGLDENGRATYDGLTYTLRIADVATGQPLTGYRIVPDSVQPSSFAVQWPASGERLNLNQSIAVQWVRDGVVAGQVQYPVGAAAFRIDAADPDSTPGIDGRDFKVSWATSAADFRSTEVYLVSADHDLYAGKQPVGLVLNPATTWSGTRQLTLDSEGNPLTERAYKIYLVVKTRQGNFVQFVTFTPHLDVQTSKPSPSTIRTYNYAEGPDEIRMIDLRPGALVKVYDAPIGGRLLAEATAVQTPDGARAAASIPQGFDNGLASVYVTVTHPGEVESERTAQTVAPNPAAPAADRIRIDNRASGPDSVTVDLVPAQATVEVYDAGTGGVLLAKARNESQTAESVELTVPDGLEEGALVYAVVTVAQGDAYAWSLRTAKIVPPSVARLIYATGPYTFVDSQPRQLQIRAAYSDGSERDVTNEAIWSSADDGVVAVTATGSVIPHANGATTVTAAFGGLQAQFSVEVRFDAIAPLYLYSSTDRFIDGGGSVTNVVYSQDIRDNTSERPLNMGQAKYLIVKFSGQTYMDQPNAVAKMDGANVPGSYVFAIGYGYLAVQLPDVGNVPKELEITGVKDANFQTVSPIRIFVFDS
ncbi:S-layer homology domain-containing protein [Cohnella sp. REN36]|uniref:S-layer homology domain-containing protein n=1 Tax=Cohnella sp. REN36 TaxID=2887347 RepID=UPI001D14750E|nr:S-layer homology domain-containing protein [Cohnella sp. REN36]MCC3374401.1 S-layer homology domain-containing protein [Cohnella sp. REN36]